MASIMCPTLGSPWLFDGDLYEGDPEVRYLTVILGQDNPQDPPLPPE